MRRRDFLKLIGATSAGLALPPAVLGKISTGVEFVKPDTVSTGTPDGLIKAIEEAARAFEEMAFSAKRAALVMDTKDVQA